MIDRYWGQKMRTIWQSQAKFTKWLKVEIAVLSARESLGQVPEGTADAVAMRTWMDEKVAQAIERRDREICHDLNAFVEIMRLQLIASREEMEVLFSCENDGWFHNMVRVKLASQGASPLASWFHDGMTSYDTEEPAMAMLLRDSCDQIAEELEGLRFAIGERALRHRGLVMVGRTHGQHAQPITFGAKLAGYYDMIDRAETAFLEVREEILVMKLSGAVGMYGTLGPDVEERVGGLLHLSCVIATQILPLERRARLVNELAIIASVLEKIALDLWLMSQTEVGEIREPFGKSQKGSSAMPHKKNPITLEQVRGLARVVRGSAMAVMENIATAHERDISHSSVERLALVDAFGVLDHMLRGLRRVIDGMDVFPERMKENLDRTFGAIASQRVEMWLKAQGMPAEAAYRAVQRLCADAVEGRTPLMTVLSSDIDTRSYAEKDPEGLAACFDWKTWVEQEAFVLERAGVKE